jgi:hypothetical protein
MFTNELLWSVGDLKIFGPLLAPCFPFELLVNYYYYYYYYYYYVQYFCLKEFYYNT